MGFNLIHQALVAQKKSICKTTL